MREFAVQFGRTALRGAVYAAAVAMAAPAAAQAPNQTEDPFAPKNTVPFDVNISYDLGASSVKTIYVTPSSHWDREFTDPDDVERDQLVTHIDDVIATLRANPQMRWQEEAIWHIEGWLRSDPSPARQEQLFSLIRSGQLSVGATEYMVNALPDEIMGRICYKGADLAQRHRVRFETALAADYVGLSWMHVQDLARSGVKYLLNSHHITFPPPDGLPRKQLPFWWEGPDGSRVMVWRVEYTSAIYPWCTNPSNARFFSTREMGKPAAALEDMALTEVALKHQLKRLAQEGYDKDAVLLIDSHDNVRASNAVRLIEHFRKWNATHASPKLRLAVPEEFFRHMEAKYGKDLPVYRGEYRDQYAGPVFRRASGRQAATDLVEAEKLSSFNDLKGADTFPAMMDRQCMLDFFEMASHGGGAWWASQLQSDYTKFRRDQLQSMLPARAYYMRRMALSAVGQRILAPKPSLAVVNSLGWNRSGIVEIPVTEDFFTTRSQLRDAATGAIVPAEWATLDTPQPGEKLPGPMRDKKWFAGELGYGRLRFRADDVPAMGYRVFEVVEAPEGPRTAAVETVTSGATVENKFFRLTLGPAGRITGLYDKRAARELMAPGTTETFASLAVLSLRGMRSGAPRFSSTDLADTTEPVTIRRGPVATVVEVRRPGGVIGSTQITLPEDAPQIRVRNTVSEEKLLAMGRSRWQTLILTLPFSYRTRQFDTRIQLEQTVRGRETNESTKPAGEWAAGAIGWGAHFGDGTHGTVISSREVSDIPESFNKEQGEYATVRLAAMPGFAQLGEEGVCEFVISTDSGSTASAPIFRQSLDGAYPLRAVPVRTGELMPWEKADDFLHQMAESIVTVDSPDVIVTALKRARGGGPREYAIRLVEASGSKPSRAKVTLPAGVRTASLADQTERPTRQLRLERGSVTVDLTPNQQLTLRFTL